MEPLTLLALGALAVVALAELRDRRGLRHRLERRLRGISEIGVDQAAIERRLRAL